MPDLAAQAGLVLHNIGLTDQLRARLASCRPRGCGSSPPPTTSGGGSSATSTTAPSSNCSPSPTRWPQRSRWPARTRGGNGPWSHGSRPRPAARWRPCANSPAASTRRCSPTRACPPPSAPGGQGTRAGRGEHRRRGPLPAGDRDRHLLLLRGSTAQRRPACAGIGGEDQPGRHRDGPKFEVTDNGPGFDPAAVAASGLRNMSDRLAALGGSSRSTPPPAGEPPSPAESGWPTRWPETPVRCRSPPAWGKKTGPKPACPCRPRHGHGNGEQVSACYLPFPGGRAPSVASKSPTAARITARFWRHHDDGNADSDGGTECRLPEDRRDANKPAGLVWQG